MDWVGNMKEIEVILSLIVTSCGFLISTLTLLCKLIKNSKAKKYAQGVIRICEVILPYIQEAEKFIHYTSTEKKGYVMTKAMQEIITNKMKISQDFLSKAIDNLITFTKHVNIHNYQSKDINNYKERIGNTKELGKLYD